jgi:hypothetical protein
MCVYIYAYVCLCMYLCICLCVRMYVSFTYLSVRVPLFALVPSLCLLYTLSCKYLFLPSKSCFFSHIVVSFRLSYVSHFGTTFLVCAIVPATAWGRCESMGCYTLLPIVTFAVFTLGSFQLPLGCWSDSAFPLGHAIVPTVSSYCGTPRGTRAFAPWCRLGLDMHSYFGITTW